METWQSIRRFQLLVFLLGVIFLGACDQSRDASIMIYDDNLRVAVLEELQRNDVDFELNGDTIWYSIDDREIVALVYDQQIEFRTQQFNFYELGVAEEFMRILDDAGISAEKIDKDEDVYIVRVSADEQDTAEKLMRDVLFANQSSH